MGKEHTRLKKHTRKVIKKLTEGQTKLMFFFGGGNSQTKGTKDLAWSVDLAQCQAKKDKAFVLECGSLPHLPITPLVGRSLAHALSHSFVPAIPHLLTPTLALSHLCTFFTTGCFSVAFQQA